MPVMNLRDEILKEHSKAQCLRIVAYIGNSQERFDELAGLFLNNEYRVAQRAAWPLSYCVASHPGLIKKQLKKIILNLKKPGIHNAVKRNTVRLLQNIDIPKPLRGYVMAICFGYLDSPGEPVAIKAFSLSVLARLSKEHPEIVPEIKLLIEEQLPYQTAAFASRAKRVLKEMKP
jgi:hypothetical protein